MPLVPEKLNSRQEVRNAISSQFWDQPVHSARSLDGTARTLACEPPPVGQTAASGLLRSQGLLATQAAGLPLMPGFCKHQGGVVSCLITSPGRAGYSPRNAINTAHGALNRQCAFDDDIFLRMHILQLRTVPDQNCLKTYTGAGQGYCQSWRKTVVGKLVWQG